MSSTPQQPGLPPGAPRRRPADKPPPVPRPAKPPLPTRQTPAGGHLGLIIGLSAAAIFGIFLVGGVIGAFLLGVNSSKDDKSEEIVQRALGDQNEGDKETIDKSPNQDDKDNDNSVAGTSTNQNTGKTTDANSTETEPAFGPPKFPKSPNDQSVIPGAEFTVDVGAISDRPEGKLHYSLVEPPVGATISNGKFCWRPTAGQSGKSYPVTVSVAIENHPEDGLAETSFTVVVPDPFADIRKNNGILDLPNQPARLSLRGESSFQELTKLYLDPSVDLKLELAGVDLTRNEDYEIFIDKAEPGKWTLKQKQKKVGSGSLAPPNPREVAALKLESESLQFRWGNAAPEFKLGACLLVFQVNGLDKQVCKLTNPKEVQPIPMGFQDVYTSKDIPLDQSAIPGRDRLLVDAQFKGFPEVKSGAAVVSGLAVDSNRKVQFPGGKQGGPLLELAVALHWEDGKEKPDLLIKPYAFPIEENSGELQRVQLVISGNRGSTFLLPDTLKDGAENIRESAKSRINNFAETIANKEAALRPHKERIQEMNPKIAKLEKVLKEQQDALSKAGKEGQNERQAKLANKVKLIKKELEELKVYKAEVEDDFVYQGLFRKVDDLTQKLNLQKRLLKNSEANMQYAEQLSQLINTLESSGEIHYRVYFKVEESDIKEKIDVLQTPMFAAAN